MTPEHIQKLLADAAEFHRAGLLQDALVRYERVLAVYPYHFEANHLAGLVALREGRVFDSLEYLERAHRVEPRDPICEMRLALACSAADRNEEAEARLRALTGREPGWHEAWDHLGRVQQTLGRLQDAICSYRRAVLARPDYAPGWCNLGLALLSAGQPDEALECVERSLSADPRQARALRAKTVILAASSATEPAANADSHRAATAV